MATPMYLGVDGRQLYRAETGLHHAIHERRNYRTPIEKRFRGMGGMVVRMANHYHRELHANVPPPPKVSPLLMQDIYLHARPQSYETAVDLFGSVVDYIGLVADNNPTFGEEAQRLHDNLVAQQHFIELGAVMLEQAAAHVIQEVA